jgi:hypothetical protein
MAGRYAASGRPSMTTPAAPSRGGPRHSAALGPRTFSGTPLTVQGVTRDAMAASSLLGSSIPKGPLAFGIAASHGAAAFTLATNQSGAQVNVETAMANLEAISKSRALRAVARNAEGVAPTADPTTVQSARLLATGRGPLVSVLGLTAGDLARTVSEFDRYGYTVNRAMVPPRLDAMTKRTYWQTADTTVLGDMPQEDRQAIAAAFERGVTVWTSVAEVGTKPANPANAGVTY